MIILYTHVKGTQARIPVGDDLAEYAVSAYDFCLNTDARRGLPHTGPQFAEAIAEVFSMDCPRNAAVCEHLKSLG
jgi:hypothetical protein